MRRLVVAVNEHAVEQRVEEVGVCTKRACRLCEAVEFATTALRLATLTALDAN